ncbi:MAG: dCTP diphosphatase [Cognaticolwellia sp.]
MSEKEPSLEPSGVTLAELQTQLRAFNQERDWGQYHNPRNLAMALSVESAEVLELYLWSSDQGPQPPVASRVDKVPHELADVLICLLNLADHAKVDLASAFQDKLAMNAEKYPASKVAGRMEKYSEYE